MPRLTAEEWQRLLPLLKNINLNRQEAARRRLVDGTTLVAAGEPFGYSKSDVSYIVKLVLRWWDKLNSLPDKPKPPPGWTVVELIVPRGQVDKVRRVVGALYPPPATTRAASKARPTTKPAKRKSRVPHRPAG